MFAWKCIECSAIIGKMLRLAAEISVAEPVNVSSDPDPDHLKKHWVHINPKLIIAPESRKIFVMFF